MYTNLISPRPFEPHSCVFLSLRFVLVCDLFLLWSHRRAFQATEIVIDIIYHAYTIFCVAIIHATIFVFIHVCRKMPENFQLHFFCVACVVITTMVVELFSSLFLSFFLCLHCSQFSIHLELFHFICSTRRWFGWHFACFCVTLIHTPGRWILGIEERKFSAHFSNKTENV